MILAPGGIDIFYVDESHDPKVYAVSAVTIPFLRPVNGIWTIVWPDHLAAAQEWRKRLYRLFKIPTGKELHGVKLASGRGRYKYNKHQFGQNEALSVYKGILSEIDFIPSGSVFSVVGGRGHMLYGRERLERVMHVLFQRMRMQCRARKTNGMVFFDQGHPEYRRLYRQAQRFLPTGSSYGLPSESRPLDMFVKDANEKNSAFCHFTQAVDLIAYAVFSQSKSERQMAGDDSCSSERASLYSSLPSSIINRSVSKTQPRDGIVRLY